MNKFQPLVIRNDRTVACMLAMPSKFEMSSIELFIEHAPDHPPLNNETTHFTESSTNGIDVDEEIERDKEDGMYDVVPTNEFVLPGNDENCGHRESVDLITVQQVTKSESTRYVNLEVGDRYNDPDVEVKVENTLPVVSPHDTQVNISNDNDRALAPISYYMPPTPQFLSIDGISNCVVSD